MISREQCRAARGLLDWSQAELARRSGLSVSAIRDFENGHHVPHAANLDALIETFRLGGVEFTNGERPGVRLARR